MLVLLFSIPSFAQVVSMDTANLRMIDIKGDTLRGFKSETESYQRILGSVIITHDGSTMTCDSAHFYADNNTVEAFSNVNITSKNGTTAKGDYIKYTGHNNTAFMKGSVQIVDAANTLYTEQLTYNLKTKVGNYFDGGTLQTEETTVSSNEGMYNGFTKQTYFKKDVIITNPKYTIESRELTYNTNSKVIKFLDESVIMGETDTVHTTAGTYDSKNEQASFTKRTSITSKDQTITGNTLQYDEKTGFGKAKGKVSIEQEGGKNTITADETEYNKKTGYAKATGNVVLTDTAEHSRLLCGVVEFNDNSKFMLATVNPKLISLADNDSLYMRADTMMSIRERDKKNLKLIEILLKDKKNKIKKQMFNLLVADSTYRSENTEEPKLILCNHRVKIFSDSMQAVCDSLSYSQIDSTFRLFKSPVLWNKTNQSNADTIYIHTINNKLSEVNLKSASLLVSQTGFKNMYDQVAGNFIDAFFKENEIFLVKVDQNAESIYYAKDDDGAYIGMNKAESAKMNVYFEDKEVSRIVMLEDPKGNTIPIDKINESDRFLSSFKLFTERRPKSKNEILKD